MVLVDMHPTLQSRRSVIILLVIIAVGILHGCSPQSGSKSDQPDVVTPRPERERVPNNNAASELPDCNDLFATFFSNDQPIRPDMHLGKRTARPDSKSVKAAKSKIEKLLSDAKTEWPGVFDVDGEPSIEWVSKFDQHHNRPVIQAVIDNSDPNAADNEYVRQCGEFGVVLAEALTQQRPALQWRYEEPYWNSYLYDPSSTYCLNVFHWSIKKMSEYGVDDGFSTKVVAADRALESAAQKIRKHLNDSR